MHNGLIPNTGDFSWQEDQTDTKKNSSLRCTNKAKDSIQQNIGYRSPPAREVHLAGNALGKEQLVAIVTVVALRSMITEFFLDAHENSPIIHKQVK